MELLAAERRDARGDDEFVWFGDCAVDPDGGDIPVREEVVDGRHSHPDPVGAEFHPPREEPNSTDCYFRRD